jgi:RHS repeat-associated protein
MRTFQKKNKSRQIFLQLAFVIGIISVLFCKVHAQANETPQRGFHPAGSYALTDIETINTNNGNLMLRLPMASLPAGRGGSLSASIGLFYNSKIWDSQTLIWKDTFNNTYTDHLLRNSPEGGWRYGFEYKPQLFDRLDQYDLSSVPPCTDAEVLWRYKLQVSFPDGSLHEFRPSGDTDLLQDGYFAMRPDGWRTNCYGDSPHVSSPMTYYSIDGAYLRLEFAHDGDGDWTNNPWTLYFPDGGRVTGGNAPQRIYDRNNNYLEIQNITYNSHAATRIVDQLGRQIIIEYAGNEDHIHKWGFNGQQLQWTVKWKTISAFKSYFPGQGGLQNLAWTLRVVDQIILPAQAGALSYTFSYNAGASAGTGNPSYGWGEVSSIILPSGAQASYQYEYDGDDSLSWSQALENYATRKDLAYQREYDGSSTPVTETWLYSIQPLLGFTITEPNGGVLRESHDDKGHSIVTEKPDGSVIERIWRENIPVGNAIPDFTDVNPFVKTEFTSIRNSSGSLVKTAIKDYAYDKNGNVTQVAEYDWVDYGSVPRVGGRPTGVPGVAPLKRVTFNTYYNPTPDALNTTADDPDVYHKPSSPNIKRAIEFSETRSDFGAGSVISRAESFYDNPATTGNLTMERKWDSTNGGISRPLGAGNSISVTHQYDSFGNPTLTTDANGVQTQFIYDPINGHGNLYVTQTKVAPGAAVQRWTMQSYDFHTGLVTQSTDVDNNVTTRTTYDVFGRPTLVEEADGIAGVEKQTATEYSDTERRVIVRSDLNTAGDGKLIAIQHYDQLGRICLTRRLESGNPVEATDKTKGVKTQNRYFAGDSNNSYELVSAPYRAATSGAAGGEPGMAWKRTRFDKGGRVIEVETFIGATPPAPWGGNSVSSGKTTTEYDAELTTVTDQAGKRRRSRVDALGRLVRVDEPDAIGNLGGATAPVQPTDYTYDALNNLIRTSQTGVPNGGSTPVTQNRYFSYSSLGRLISANNPESGLISYKYDANRNLKEKTDARGITINYAYDELNRNRTVDYSNTAVNPDITREYDNPAAGEYGKGRLWRSYAGGNESAGQNVEKQEVMGYDALGNAKSVRQSFKNNSVWSGGFTTSQTYDLAGHVKTKTYPSGRSVTYAYDVSGDLTGFTGNIGDGAPRTYSTGIQYNPQGQMIREQFGTSTSLYHRRHYNSWGKLFDVRLGTDGGAINDGPNPAQWTGASWNRGALRMFFSSNLIEYAWPTVAPQNNNGNLYRQDHFVPTALDGAGNVAAWVMSADYYCYDSLNRVAQTAEETYASAGGYTPNVFNQQFSYDRFGNRLVSSTFGTGAPNPGYKINGVNNRLIAPTDADGSQASDRMQYDASGNLIKDTQTQTSATGNRTYDAENRMLSADSANGLANSYVYDADGHRTRRSINNGGEVWWQVYGIGGELVAEYQLVSGAPMLRKEYGYRHGQLLVVWDGSETGDRQLQWLVQDHLGSTRMVVDRSGSLGGIRRHDFLPFGEELSAGVGIRSAALGYGADSTRQKFTGKERDSETGLDYFHARYYSNIQGRFTSVDPENAGAIEDDPQSWNGYAYARNAPVVYSDPDGRRYRICSTDGECYEHSDDDFNAGRRAGTKDGFTFSGDGKYHETGDIRDKDGNLVATYEQISLDEPAHQLAFEMQRQFGSPDLYMRVARNLVGGAAMAAIAGRGGTIPAPRPFNPRVNTTSPTRGAALKEAKLANDIPLSRGPDRIIKPNTPGGAEVGLRSGDNVRLYEYTNSRGQKIWIREDKAASYGAPGGKGDQGPHFNSGPAGARQQDLKNHHYWSQ